MTLFYKAVKPFKFMKIILIACFVTFGFKKYKKIMPSPIKFSPHGPLSTVQAVHVGRAAFIIERLDDQQDCELKSRETSKDDLPSGTLGWLKRNERGFPNEKEYCNDE